MLEKLLLGLTVKFKLSNISVFIVLLFNIVYGVQHYYALAPARHTRFTLSISSGNRRKSFTKIPMAIITTKIVLLKYRDLYFYYFGQIRTVLLLLLL